DREADESPRENAMPSGTAAPVGSVPATELPQRPEHGFPPPRVQRVSEELQREIDEALGGASLDDLFKGKSSAVSRGPEPELDKRYRGIVFKIHRDDVFVSLPANYEGVVPFRQFIKEPAVGDAIEVIVASTQAEEGLYPLRLAGASVEVGDWSDLAEGMVVEAKVVGHNAGGLECEVNRLRAFIPVSQVSVFRVEKLDEFVGEKFPCLVTEANPMRQNLVLSRRAILEREREESRQETLQGMEIGQIREGIIRSVRDFGAFVDLGGIDGLIHVSKLSWDRIQHANEVVQEGQKVKVRVEKIDPITGKISLSYRDLVEQPWDKAESEFPVDSVVTGTVTRTMDFGAFVKLAAGIEGLIHISELAHHRVSRVTSVVQVGQEVQVKVLSIDPESQRMSLSLKAAMTPKAKEGSPAEPEDEAPAEPTPTAQRPGPAQPLKGGMDRRTGGESLGLKW
ncbi:MAG TPA: S1 RNA-binding domain-containing protein, partial [Pirellulaceae bacterium]